MPTGIAIVDFGAHPGSSTASVAVTGQGAITTSSFVEAWIRAQDGTADHSAEEHVAERLKIVATNIVAATGFTIHAECENGASTGQWEVNWVWT